MSSQEGKYLHFHHGTPEAVTPPRRARSHGEPRSPCPSIPTNPSLTGAPPAACPPEEEPAQTRGVGGAAAQACAERRRGAGVPSGGGCPSPDPRPRRRVVLEGAETWGETTAVSQISLGEPAKPGGKDVRAHPCTSVNPVRGNIDREARKAAVIYFLSSVI